MCESKQNFMSDFKTKIVLIGSFLFILSGCDTTDNLYPDGYTATDLPADSVSHTMYLIGDAGISDHSPTEPSLKLLEKMLKEADPERSSVIFLGDNVYPSGLHDEGHPMREQDINRLHAQLNILLDYEGRVAFIPGNHDWYEGKTMGDAYIDRQAKYVEEYLGNDEAFIPKGGCPGPVEISLSDNLTWIILDTQWWFQLYRKENSIPEDCEVTKEDEFIEAVRASVERNSDKQIIVSAHHPLYSNGTHGGYFPFRDHIFPLTHLQEYLYIPLPVLGSAYPVYRSQFGNVQDLAHDRYQELIENLTGIFRSQPGLIYTAGHEHNLQYQKHDGVHYIVSGSGSKRGYLWDNDALIYGRAARGFAKLIQFSSGEVWLEFYTPLAEDPMQATYRVQLTDGYDAISAPAA
jgi:UDP-2,3-diacylglucosamine pyrophosphatase LpxH